jgi:hypothetical protein
MVAELTPALIFVSFCLCYVLQYLSNNNDLMTLDNGPRFVRTVCIQRENAVKIWLAIL